MLANRSSGLSLNRGLGVSYEPNLLTLGHCTYKRHNNKTKMRNSVFHATYITPYFVTLALKIKMTSIHINFESECLAN